MAVNLIAEYEEISDAQKSYLRNAAAEVLSILKVGPVEITVVISDDETLKNLNKTYLLKDYATDVLSFSANEIDPETGTKYLGDIIISMDQAKKQSVHNNISLLQELSLLLVHGILHLLGHDHSDADQETAMFALQNQILASIEVNGRE